MNLILMFIVVLAAAVYARNSDTVGNVILEIWDSGDDANLTEANQTKFYANYTDSGNSITGANCTLNISSSLANFSYNSTTELYEFSSSVRVGEYNYSVSCNQSGYPHLNVSDLLNISNRNPIIYVDLVNITVYEDSYNDTVNLSNYFIDLDTEHNLTWNFTEVDNLTISINNNTGIINITPQANYYGAKSINITAIDPLNATNTSYWVNITVVNRPEIILSTPADGNPTATYYANDTIVFRATVSDDFPFANCSLLIDDTINATNTTTVPHNGTATEIIDFDSQDSTKDLDNAVDNITKQINVTSSVNKVKIYAREHFDFADDSMDDYVVYINGQNVFNITDLDLPTGGLANITFDVSSSDFNEGELNNITIVGPGTLSDSKMRIGIDSTDTGNSFYDGSTDETGEYMISLEAVSNELVLNASNLSKGNHSWNVQCVNNRSESGTAASDYTVVINDSLPDAPTAVLCNGGDCDGGEFSWEINVSCSGSTDLDGDAITYALQYTNDLENYFDISTFNGTRYEWDVSSFGGQTLYLRCYPSGTSASQNNYQTGSFTVNNPGAPEGLDAENITCNGGYCNSSAFDTDTINVTCNSSQDPDSEYFSYRLEAEYETINGTGLHNVTDADLSDDNHTITWNVTSIYNQSDVRIRCILTNNTAGLSTGSNFISNITLNKSGMPGKPTASTEIDGDNVNISCSGDVNDFDIYAYYKTARYKDQAWEHIGQVTGSSELAWNGSQVYEQSVSFKCQSYSGAYYSEPSDASSQTLSHPPSNPTEVIPSGSQNFEHWINYSCSGSNNSESFNYTVEAFYDDAWHLLNASFPGIIEIDDAIVGGSSLPSYLAYDDGVTLDDLLIIVKASIIDGDYQVCVESAGSGNIVLNYNCDSNGNNCGGSSILASTASSAYHCSNLSLTGLQQVLKVDNSEAEADIDVITFEALPFSWNVSGVVPEESARIRCVARDGQGNSSYLESGVFTIDRPPEYNWSTSTFAYSGSLQIDLDEMFYDPDTEQFGDSLTFTVHNESMANSVVEFDFGRDNKVNFTQVNYGLEEMNITASDGIVNTTQTITVGVNAPASDTGGGSSNRGALDVDVTKEEIVKEVTGETGGEEVQEPEVKEPEVEVPAPTPPPSGGGKPTIEDFAEKIVDKNYKHTRHWSVSGSRTQITESVKNIHLFDLENVQVLVDFPKDIVDDASKIGRIDPFTIIEKDPKVMFFVQKVKPGEEAKIRYSLNKALTPSQINRIVATITPQEISEEERARREQELKEKINETAKYVNLTRDVEIDAAKEETKYTVNIDFKGENVLYDVTIYEEIPKCLVEIIKEEMIHSDHDFEIISEDPLIAWHFEELYREDRIIYSIKKIADEDCANRAAAVAVAQEIIAITEGIDISNIAIFLFLIPLIITPLLFFSKFGEKQALKAESGQTSWITRLEIDVEEGILLLIIVMSVMETLGVLPVDAAMMKKVMSWTIMGFLFYKVSITNIIFGVRKKLVDIVVIIAFFMMTIKNLIAVAKVEFLEAGFSKDLLLMLLRHNELFEVTFFVAGLVILLAVSLYTAYYIKIHPPSFLTLIGEDYHENRSLFHWIIRFIVVHLSLLFFFVVIFNIAMEWLAIAVDAPLVTMAVFIFLFVLIKHRKHAMVHYIYEVGGIGEKFYHRFIELFHYKKFILLGISGMLVLHSLVEIGTAIIPYITGVYEKFYFGLGAEGHKPIFGILTFLHEHIPHESLFFSETAGMPWHFSAILLMVYILNIAAMVFLLGLPAILWYHMYKNRKLPVSKVPPFRIGKLWIALFWASIVSWIFAPAFKISTLQNTELFGVDMLTQGIASNPYLSLVLAASVALGIVVYAATMTKLKIYMQRLMVFFSLGFFLYYLWIFFTNVQRLYVYQMQVVQKESMLVFGHIFLFLVISVIFYLGGIGFLAVELWLRNEIGLRSLPIDQLPFFKHHDMDFVHYERAHQHEKHGGKIEFLQNYIINHLNMGQEIEDIAHTLASHHWPVELIEEAVVSATLGREYVDRITRVGIQKRYKKSLTMLRNYMIRHFNAGENYLDIIKKARNRGWKDIYIEEAARLIKFKSHNPFLEYFRRKNGN